jgi:Na+/H+ antiporter NhaD/arsenite permease-like protein
MDVELVHFTLITSIIVSIILMLIFFGIPKGSQNNNKETISKKHLDKVVDLTFNLSLYVILLLGVVKNIKEIFLLSIMIIFSSIIGFRNE